MKKVGLIVGHKPNAKGAVNKNSGITEFDFNSQLAPLIAEKLMEKGYDPVIIYRDTYSGLPTKVNNINPDIAVSLHCNAFNSTASGSEVLYYYKSTKGKLLAECLQKELVHIMAESDRGVKPIAYSYVGKAGDKGGWLVQKTSMPVVIAEPFFIDNNASLRRAQTKLKFLADAYAKGIDNYFKV